MNQDHELKPEGLAERRAVREAIDPTRGGLAKVIGFTAYRRPDYLSRMLDALSRCDGIAEYLILAHVEPGDDRVRHLVESIDFAECVPTFNRGQLGCDANTMAVHRHGFERSDYAIFIEEDVIFSRDALRFYEWAGARYRDDPAVSSVTAFNANREACPPPEDHCCITRRGLFHGISFATWRDRFAPVDGLAVSQPDQPGGWDIRYKERLIDQGGMREAYPLLGRCDHIGLETSTQTDPIFTPDWFWHNCRAGHWAGTIDPAPGQFHDR